MEAKICTNEVLLDLLFKIRYSQNRSCVTQNEIERYKEYIASEAQKSGINVTFVHDVTGKLDVIRSLIDTIIVDGQIVYRLNSSVSHDDVRKLTGFGGMLEFYETQHVDIVCSNEEEFLSTLTDFTAESEKECAEFKKADERRELEMMYQLIELRRQRNNLRSSLWMMDFNEARTITDEEVDDVYKQNPNITKEEFMAKFGR